MGEGPPANVDDSGRRSVRRWRVEGGGGAKGWMEGGWQVDARMMDDGRPKRKQILLLPCKPTNC